MFTKGNTDEVREAIERGLLLAENLGNDHHQQQLLAGLNIYITRIGDFAGALHVAHRTVAIAQRLADRFCRRYGRLVLGVIASLNGSFSVPNGIRWHHTALSASGFEANWIWRSAILEAP